MRAVLLFLAATTFAAITACAVAPQPTQTVASNLEPVQSSAAPVALENVEVKEVPIAENAGSPDELICTREKVTGSHMPVRICRTRAQIEETREEAQELIRNRGALRGFDDSGGEQ